MGPRISGGIERRSSLRLLFEERLLSHNIIVGTGTVAAGVLGIAFQAAASHQLKPADYGAVFAVITFLTLIGLPASAFTLLMARETSRDRAIGELPRSATLMRRGNRALLLGGTAIALFLAAASSQISSFLGTEAPLILAAAIGIPSGLALPLLLGVFQGEQRFVIFSILSVLQAALKLGSALALGWWLGPVGVIAGISVASVAVYCIALALLFREPTTHVEASWWRPAARYLAIVVPSTLAIALLLSADVLLVKHYFPARASGEYAVVAAIGRAIFWGASAVAAVLFPKAVFRLARGHSTSFVLGGSLLLVGLGGLFALSVLSISSTWLITAFAGSAYAGGAAYLPWYAVGMTLLGAATVLTASLQSLGRAGFLVILIPLAVLEPVLIGTFHATLAQVILLLNASMALLTIGLAIWFLAQQRAARLRLAAIPPTESRLVGAQQLQVNR
ncbi:MAG TPA: hypothetical protein VJQ08_06610 [Candidatus Dormibacteraeota bacterium]|nr:hypothetical protein [Candidatus Dormibacteraeota bacterium]